MNRNTRNILIFLVMFMILLAAVNLAVDHFGWGYRYYIPLYAGYILLAVAVFVVAVKRKIIT